MPSPKFIKVEDNGHLYSVDHFSVPRHYEDSIGSILIPHGLIADRIERMARDIHEGFEGESMILLCILKGGFRFSQDLMNYIGAINCSSGRSFQIGLDFLRLKSYTNEESGELKIMGVDGLESLKGKDIVDTGNTMQQLLKTLDVYQPKSVKVASLLLKRRPDSTGYIPDYVGFEIPNKFVIGYALDYNEYFRDLNHICVINDFGKKKYAI